MSKYTFIAMIALGILVSCNDNYKEKFQRIAELENQSCPRRLDKNTVMDSTKYDAMRNVVHYYYTLSGELDNAAYLKENADLHKIELQKAVLNLLETQEYVKHGTGFHIVYHSQSTGNVIAEFSF